MQIFFLFFRNLAVFLSRELQFLWLIGKKTLSNSVRNRTRDKQIGLPLRGRPTFSSLVWWQTPLSPITSTYDHSELKEVTLLL